MTRDQDGRDGRGAVAALGREVLDVVERAVASELGTDPEDVRVVGAERLSGGASRLTWRVQADPPATVIVQRERPGSAGVGLAMSSQAQLLRAAAARGVPVPGVLAEGGGSGSGFVVLSFVEGESVPRRVLRDDALTDARAGLAREAGAVLARIHSIDAGGTTGLAHGDPVEQMRALLDSLGEPHPAFELALAWLGEHRPEPRDDAVVHGDFRLGNLLVGPGGLAAVLDWELAHVGSPVEDLGWFCTRAWRFGSPLRAGGVGTLEELLEGYAGAGGRAPDEAELRWWEAYGCLRWGLICVRQASVHLGGLHRSVELAAIGRRAAECEEDLLELVVGPSDYEPPAPSERQHRGGPHDRPSAPELLAAVEEHLEGLRDRLRGAEAFQLRVAGNVLAMVGREVVLGGELADAHAQRLAGLGVRDDTELSMRIRNGEIPTRPGEVTAAVRAAVRDKLAVANPGYWRGDGTSSVPSER